MFFLRNRLPDRYNPTKNIAPGHPLYERIRREVEAELRRKASDPKQVERVRMSIERKIESVRREVEMERAGDWAKCQDSERSKP